MKVDPEQAISSIIAYKENHRKQLEHEDKLMFDLIKNRKDFEKKQEDWMIKTSGLKKKDLDNLRKTTKKDFEKSVEAFKKIKRPKKEPAQQLLSRYATAFNKPGGNDLQHPGHDPGPHTPEGGEDIPQAICFTSAIRCEGASCERQNAALFPVFESDGVGGYFGNIATAVPADLSNSLYFLFVPLQNGTANILAEVLLTGVITAATTEMIALNFFVPILGARSMADVKLSLRMNVWKDNTIIKTTQIPITDIHCQDGERKFLAFRNDLFVLQTSTIVTEQEWIVIEIRVVANLVGRSHFGVVAVDFAKGRKLNGFDSGIRVPQLCVFVNPL